MPRSSAGLCLEPAATHPLWVVTNGMNRGDLCPAPMGCLDGVSRHVLRPTLDHMRVTRFVVILGPGRALEAGEVDRAQGLLQGSVEEALRDLPHGIA